MYTKFAALFYIFLLSYPLERLQVNPPCCSQLSFPQRIMVYAHIFARNKLQKVEVKKKKKNCNWQKLKGEAPKLKVETLKLKVETTKLKVETTKLKVKTTKL